MGEYNPQVDLTKGQKEKAVRMVEQERLDFYETKVYLVEGDNDLYCVILFVDESLPHVCSCEREGTCSHMAAAILQEALLEQAPA